jgi:hypothetical protein
VVFQVALSSRDIAQAAADKERAKRKTPKASEGFRFPRAGNDTEWSTTPFYRGGSRPPRVAEKRDATTSTDSSGNKRQFFNPKAKIDTSGVEDRRVDHGWSQPKGAKGYHPTYTTYPKPGFKFNTDKSTTRPGPPPKSKSDTDDMVSSRAPRTTPMENVIKKAKIQQAGRSWWSTGKHGYGQ